MNADYFDFQKGNFARRAQELGGFPLRPPGPQIPTGDRVHSCRESGGKPRQVVGEGASSSDISIPEVVGRGVERRGRMPSKLIKTPLSDASIRLIQAMRKIDPKLTDFIERML